MEQVASDFWAVLWRCLCLLLVFILAIVAAASTEQAMAPGETPVKSLLLEAIPFIGLALGTVLLIRFVPPVGIDAALSMSNAGRHLGAGLIIGLVWVSVTLAIVSVAANLRLMPQNLNFSAAMTMAALALLTNVAMQQLLTRGYIFGVIDWKYGSAAAITVTSLLFLAFHPGAFAAGGVAIANVLMVGVIFGLARELTGSLFFAAGMHFAWNFMGAVILGLIPLNAYPTMKSAELTGNPIWIGGADGIETGLAVTIANGLLLAGLLAMLLRRALLAGGATNL